jgi:hypothetical protein
MTRSRGKTDANQTPIVRELRKAGCSVQSLADIGKGCPDILVGWHGRTYGPYEVKLPGCELTPDEVAWWDAWNCSTSALSKHDLRHRRPARAVLCCRGK